MYIDYVSSKQSEHCWLTWVVMYVFWRLQFSIYFSLLQFSSDEGDSDLVTVSAIYQLMPNSEEEIVDPTVFDLMEHAKMLIECLHGGVSNSL